MNAQANPAGPDQTLVQRWRRLERLARTATLRPHVAAGAPPGLSHASQSGQNMGAMSGAEHVPQSRNLFTGEPSPDAERRGGRALREAPSQISVREAFVRVEEAQRRRLDLLCLALTEWTADHPDDTYPGGAGGMRSRHVGAGVSANVGAGHPGGVGAGPGESVDVAEFTGAVGESPHRLAVFGAESIRTPSNEHPAGLTLADLVLGPAGPALDRVHVLIVASERRPRAHDLVCSIEELRWLLDFEADGAGSNAVAHTVLRKLAVLLTLPAVAASIAGTVERPWRDGGRTRDHLLVGSGAGGEALAPLELHDGRVLSTTRAGRPGGWWESDFLVVRVGAAPAAKSAVRSIDALRRAHSLAEVRTDAVRPSDTESYSVRAARARQAARGERLMRQAAAGDTAAAAATFRAAVAQPGGVQPLVDRLVECVITVRDCWRVDEALRMASDTPDVTGAQGPYAEGARRRLHERLGQLLGMSAPEPPPSGIELSPVSPAIMDIAEDLVPLADPDQDGGRFLHELMPAMKNRLHEETGVVQPGVNIRDDPKLTTGGVAIYAHEILVASSTVQADADYLVVPVDSGAARRHPGRDSWGSLATSHPLTGEAGLFRIGLAADGNGAGDRFSAAEYLVYQLERTLRANLVRYLDPQDVATLVDRWAMDDPNGLVTATVPGPTDRLRLTWILRDLVADGVPIARWSDILSAIRDAGGMTMPIRPLCRAVRARLRDDLPGRRPGYQTVRIPAELETALLADPIRQGVVGPGVPVKIETWLTATMEAAGAAITVVTRDEPARERLARLLHGRYDFVTTCTESEVAPS